jgi:hypothetical protein
MEAARRGEAVGKFCGLDEEAGRRLGGKKGERVESTALC